LRDYVELYSNFKLKVKAASDLQLDTLPQLQSDVESFRRQVDENYMSDEKALKALTDEAFQRNLVDLHTVHFSLSIPEEALPQDTMRIYQAAQTLYRELKEGKTNYSPLAEVAGAKYGDLGYITAFTLPYQYENIVYSLKPGESSMPYRAKKTWHIFKVLEQRKDAGKWKIAQILFTYPPDANAATKAISQKLADSVYALLQSGGDFASLAKSFSDDKLTYQNGGELPEFGSGKFDHSFEEKVFSLKNDGDVAKPFSTAFGIHIVKRLGYTPGVTDKSDASLQYELRQKIMQDARISTTRENFARDILNKIGYKRLAGVKDEELLRFADSLSFHPEEEYYTGLPISNKSIISYKKSSLKVSDWLKFVSDYKSNFEQYKGETSKELWEKYITISALEYYKKHLEEYNNDFKFQMQEFKEGNMLFEVMERNVWTKAGADSIGLVKYYNDHKQDYKWAESADVLIVNSANEKTATEVLAALKSGKTIAAIVAEKNNEVQYDSARYELSQINGSNNAFPAGADSFSPIVKNADGSATIIKYYKFYEPNQQRSFEEARGLVINDYQNVLEQKWLEQLKKKYPVKVNEALVKTLIK
ncbi:MAG: peptidylprolyl isomerase, partial [Chitinophagaceae bacterium]